eukprot:938713-Prorocentrum_minimum.AAC.1
MFLGMFLGMLLGMRLRRVVTLALQVQTERALRALRDEPEPGMAITWPGADEDELCLMGDGDGNDPPGPPEDRPSPCPSDSSRGSSRSTVGGEESLKSEKLPPRTVSGNVEVR